MDVKFLPEEEPKEELFSVNRNLPKAEKKFTWNQRNRIIKEGKSFKYKTIIFSVAKQENWQLIITLKSSFKGAIARNKTKRIIREVYRNCKPLFNFPFGMVVTVLNNPGNLDYHKLKQQVVANFLLNHENC
ncbi:MAG: ribonuclease P protein component [Candidatus Marinimicrobia bacterium]|nr:ribonuclease P protein component [Candidatus Neomarinimicrobiota bacterium]